MRRAALLAVATVALAARPAIADDLAPEVTRTAIVTGAELAAWGALGLAQDSLAPSSCRWCNPPSLDEHARDALRWSDTATAGKLSDALAVALPLSLAGADLAMAGGDFHRAGEDVLVAGEAIAAAGLASQVVKLSVGRRRPDGSDNLSFPSGHSTFAFATAGAFGTVARLRGYRAWPWVYGVGFAVATTVAYLRVAGDKHWLTDVATGAAIGAGAGIGMPLLLHRGGGAAPPVSVTPVGVSFRFAF